MNKPIFKRTASKKFTRIFPVTGNLPETIQIVQNKDGSLALREPGSAHKQKNAAVNAVGFYRVFRGSVDVRAHRKVKGANIVRANIENSQVLAEESLEETQAIARHMDENLTYNGEFYHSLKRLVKS